MRLAQAGDKIIYEEALHDMVPMIRNFFRKFAYGKAIDIDDLIQETLVAIHQSSHAYNSDRPIKPWIFAIAGYKLKDYLRVLYRKKKLIEVDFADVEHALFEEEVLDEKEEYSLEKMLKILPEKQQKIIYELKIKGNSLQETANNLNMSVAAVKVSAHRAYKVLIKKYRTIKWMKNSSKN